MVGARLHRLRAFGVDLMRTPHDLAEHHGADSWFWGGYAMAPWCNRLPAGASRLAGHDLRLAANFRDGTAIHGEVATVPWRVTDADARAATFRVSAGGAG